MKNTERKYRKQISTNSWMVKIQRWTFGDAYYFQGYCGFFWLTWLCVLLAPLTLIGKILEFVGKFLWNSIDFESWEEYKKTKRKERNKFNPEKYAQDILNLGELLDLLKCEISDITSKIYSTEQPRPEGAYDLYINIDVYVFQWAGTNLNWRDFLPRARQIVEKQKEETARKEKIAARNKKNMQLLSQYSSYLVKPAIILGAVLVAWVVYKFLFVIILSLFTLSNLFYLGICGGIALGTCLFLFLAFLGCKKAMDVSGDIIKSLPTESISKKTHLFDVVISGIKNGFGFIFETIGMLYTKECPLIEWADETKPIEKNK